MSEQAEYRVKDRSAKVARRKSRMPVHGAALKNPDLQRVLLSGKRKRR